MEKRKRKGRSGYGRTSWVSFLPEPIKKPLKQVRWQYRRLTSSFRVLPNFLIIGAQKCGTTSLYWHLMQHPCVVPALEKEIYFFAWRYSKGVSWYRTFFPAEAYAAYYRKRYGGFSTGEATPYYIFHPHAARRAREVLPNAKIIAMLRNPVDRAYSHYHHVRHWKRETAGTFEEALALEEERLKGEDKKLSQDQNYHSFNHRHLSYVTRSIYADQLPAWLEAYPDDQVLILDLEEFAADWSQTFARILDFLDLPPWQPKRFSKYHSRDYNKMNPETRERLVELFRPHNQRLYKLLNRTFDWDR